jgi:hypothetical protein
LQGLGLDLTSPTVTGGFSAGKRHDKQFVLDDHYLLGGLRRRAIMSPRRQGKRLLVLGMGRKLGSGVPDGRKLR